MGKKRCVSAKLYEIENEQILFFTWSFLPTINNQYYYLLIYHKET